MQNCNRDLLTENNHVDVDLVRSATGWTMSECHCHPHYEIYIQLKGNRSSFVKDRVFLLKEGDIVIIKPYVVHKTSSVENQGYERLLIDFDEEYLKNLFMLCNDINVDELFEDEFCVLSSDIVNGSYLKELCSRLIFEKKHPDKNDKASINLLVGQALTVISRLNHETAFVSAAETKSYKRISEIISFIEENYYKKLSLEEISQKYYISYYYLSHAFREVTGLSFTEYVNTVRVSKARQMIKKDTYPLHVICDKTGFGSYKQFGRIFKEITGVSPSQYK